MIVVRFTWHYKSSRIEKAQQLVMEPTMPESKILRGARAYRSRTGVSDTLAVEWEFECLADWDEFSAQFFALPANADFFRRWTELDPSSTTCEVWDVIATS